MTPKIDIELLKRVRTIVAHGPCPDGYASAMILKHALPQAYVRFVQYNEKELTELKAEPGMIFCDVAPRAFETSPKAAQPADFLEAGSVVLDHHATARPVVEMFEAAGLGVFADAERDPGISGAMLAYTHVWLPLAVEFGLYSDDAREQVERFARLAGIRDTFRTKHPQWLTACAQAEALMFFGESVGYAGRLPYLTSTEEWLGEQLFTKKAAVAHKIATKDLYHLGRVAVFNSPGDGTVSDVAEACRTMELEDETTRPAVVAGFRFQKEVTERGDQLRFICSLRSVDPTVDVGAIAEANGGGGHAPAAGFSELLGGDCNPASIIAGAFIDAGRDDLLDTEEE